MLDTAIPSGCAATMLPLRRSTRTSIKPKSKSPPPSPPPLKKSKRTRTSSESTYHVLSGSSESSNDGRVPPLVLSLTKSSTTPPENEKSKRRRESGTPETGSPARRPRRDDSPEVPAAQLPSAPLRSHPVRDPEATASSDVDNDVKKLSSTNPPEPPAENPNESPEVPNPLVEDEEVPKKPKDASTPNVSRVLRSRKSIDVDVNSINDSDGTSGPTEPEQAPGSCIHDAVCWFTEEVFNGRASSFFSPDRLEAALKVDIKNSKSRYRGPPPAKIVGDEVVKDYLTGQRELLESMRFTFTIACRCLPENIRAYEEEEKKWAERIRRNRKRMKAALKTQLSLSQESTEEDTEDTPRKSSAHRFSPPQTLDLSEASSDEEEEETNPRKSKDEPHSPENPNGEETPVDDVIPETVDAKDLQRNQFSLPSKSKEEVDSPKDQVETNDEETPMETSVPETNDGLSEASDDDEETKGSCLQFSLPSKPEGGVDSPTNQTETNGEETPMEISVPETNGGLSGASDDDEDTKGSCPQFSIPSKPEGEGDSPTDQTDTNEKPMEIPVPETNESDRPETPLELADPHSVPPQVLPCNTEVHFGSPCRLESSHTDAPVGESPGEESDNIGGEQVPGAAAEHVSPQSIDGGCSGKLDKENASVIEETENLPQKPGTNEVLADAYSSYVQGLLGDLEVSDSETSDSESEPDEEQNDAVALALQAITEFENPKAPPPASPADSDSSSEGFTTPPHRQQLRSPQLTDHNADDSDCNFDDEALDYEEC